jgi:hypothetical protein
MQQPMDVQGRQVLAAERFALLRDDARAPGGDSRRARRRLGVILIAAGARLAPAEARRLTARARRV